MNVFQGRQLVITTKHGKGAVLAPILERLLGVHTIVYEDFDTDSLGTFTGEVDRSLPPMDAAKAKCLKGMEATGIDLGIANEGSFGPHPSLFFMPCNEEFLCLIDLKNDLEIFVKDISLETNYNGAEIKTTQELFDFAQRVGFPSHALILRKSKESAEDIFKGIQDQDQLEKIFSELLEKYGSVYVETDMRAMNNPSRMAFIGKLGEKLAEKTLSKCPNCQRPGFSITEVKRGLPCALCTQPTQSVLSQILECQKCGFKEERFFPNGKSEEDPMYCDFCNP
ncbi:MAG: DUF6671 family protein [Cecembia sp.]